MTRPNFNQHRPLMHLAALGMGASLLITVSAHAVEEKTAFILDFDRAISTAQQNDLWLVGNKHQQDAIDYQSIAAGTLPDPKVSINIANLPVDTFNFGQEGMTQLKVGVSQMFPRGDSLAIKQQQLQIVSSQYPFLRQNRQAQVALTAGNLWLDLYKAQESIALIERNRNLFEQLSDVAQASYSSALGKARQHDIVRAELEVTRLDERLNVLAQQADMFKERLFEWTNISYSQNENNNSAQYFSQINSNFVLPNQLPNVELKNSEVYVADTQISSQSLYEYFTFHPSIQAIERNILANDKGVELTKQSYKPQWGLNAGYGYRGDDPMGNERADLFSIGVSFDVPLFTSNKQDKQVQAAVSKMEAVKTSKILALRQMFAQFGTAKSRLHRLSERQYRYQQTLLPQMKDQADASLSAYTNDDGDFAEVVRSLIAELNTQLDSLNIDVEIQKTKIQLNYFMTHSEKHNSNKKFVLAGRGE